jgi:hypothetical protein
LEVKFKSFRQIISTVELYHWWFSINIVTSNKPVKFRVEIVIDIEQVARLYFLSLRVLEKDALT